VVNLRPIGISTAQPRAAADAVLQLIYGVAGAFKADAILKRLGITNQILVDAMLP
jgi:hypothetical protein